ncbi:unannotated protein [freshwater metagenome]|uniref:Unannotated protein n=1 Tax=freshwater metagenome TaxID=449393 RepID=A0A6J7KLD8_9ZZZZ
MGIENRDWYRNHWRGKQSESRRQDKPRDPLGSNGNSEVSTKLGRFVGNVFGVVGLVAVCLVIAVFYIVVGASLKAGLGFELPGFRGGGPFGPTDRSHSKH